MPPSDLLPASPEDLQTAILYGLRFDLTGRPHPARLTNDRRAEIIAAHMGLRGLVVMQRPGRVARPGMGT